MARALWMSVNGGDPSGRDGKIVHGLGLNRDRRQAQFMLVVRPARYAQFNLKIVHLLGSKRMHLRPRLAIELEFQMGAITRVASLAGGPPFASI